MTTFAIGDEVQIISEPPHNRESGPTWVSEMDQHANQTGIVIGITSRGYYDVAVRNGDAFIFCPWWIQGGQEKGKYLTLEDRIIAKIKYLDKKFEERKRVCA